MALQLADIVDNLAQNYSPLFVQALTRDVFFYSRMVERGRVREGTPDLSWRVNYAGNSEVAAYDETDTDDGTTGKQQYKKATLAYKSVRARVGISGLTLAISEQGGMLMNALTDEVEKAIQDLKVSINTQTLGDGTTFSGKAITGILAGIADTGTYAGLDRGTYTWWKAYVLSNGGTPRNLTEALVADMVDTIKLRGADPSALEIWCGPTQWRNFGALYKGERRQTPQRLSGGYLALDFEGTPVIQVPGYTTGRMDAVDTSKFDYQQLPVTSNSPLAKELRPIITAPGTPGFGILVMGNSGDALRMWIIHYAQLRVLNPYVMASLQDLA